MPPHRERVDMSRRLVQYARFIVLVLCLAVAGSVRDALEHQRANMGMAATGVDLKNAPRALVFATVALGGFRGLIANFLWIRMSNLQDQDKYFEMVQLADWITKLQPRLKQVWIHQAWNMAYNISVKFTEPQDRWRWVSRGIELLRDEGLRYNPDQALVYRELAWFFQHKIGQELDDAHMYYKYQWAVTMTRAIGTNRNGYLELIQPATDDARERARFLRQVLKMDPALMKAADEKYGPLDWRLPEASAIYWAMIGLEKSRPADQDSLRRVIYQSTLQSFQHGALLKIDNQKKRVVLGPNPDMVARMVAIYDKMLADEPVKKDMINRAKRNTIRQCVFHLYMNNRMAEARYWFNYLKENWPDDFQVNQSGGDLDTFALRQITEGVGETDRVKTTAILMAYTRTAFLSLIEDEDDRATVLLDMCKRIWQNHQSRVPKDPGSIARLGLEPLSLIQSNVLNQLLAPESGLTPEAKAVLLSKLKLNATK